MGRLSVEQVLALAPDLPSVVAARKLTLSGPWSDAGCDDRAVWGACRGSGRTPYRVACDTWGPAYRCSCPSQKLPCKHALALLLLWADRSPAVVESTPPPDVGAWLARRAGEVSGPADIEPVRAHDGTAAATTVAPPAAPPDPEVAAARVAKRATRIAAGMDELQRWLTDLLAAGLGWAQSQPYGYWDAMAARLVDAQAPGAGARVRRLAGVVRSGDGWPGRLLAHVARLNLLAAGWSRVDRLPEAVRADLRTAAGWPWPSDEVLAGPRERDRWYVVARSVTDEERVRAQRTWLWGLDSGRLGVVVDFARPGATFPWELWPGNVLDAGLARFPGSAPLRVLVADRYGEPVTGGPPPAWADLGEMAAARGFTVASDPWCERWPVSVRDAVPDGRAGRWSVRDRDGRRLPLAVEDEAGWRLLAVSGGRPVTLLGEWEERRVRPLGAWVDDRMVVL